MTPSPHLRLRRLATTPDKLTLEWDDGRVVDYPSIWLRDNRCQDRDAHSGQRLIDIGDIPVCPQIRSAAAADGTLTIDWSTESGSDCFDLEWLATHAAAPDERSRLRAVTWLEGATLGAQRDFAWLKFAQFLDDSTGRLAWLMALLESGIAFLSEVPCTDAALLQAMAPIGRVSETNFGAVFDVRSVAAPENLAYSDLGLGLHTDNPYRDPVPGYQALHVMRASTEGGASLFADGFALAAYLRELDPAAFELLSQTPVPFHYSSADAELHADRPLIELSLRGAVTAVHYNSRSIAPLPLGADRPSGSDVVRFYAAYRRFASLLRDPRHQLRINLEEGDLVVFDNRRILHGRTAFSAAREVRHLRGCYLTRDSLHSEAALLRRRLRGTPEP